MDSLEQLLRHVSPQQSTQLLRLRMRSGHETGHCRRERVAHRSRHELAQVPLHRHRLLTHTHTLLRALGCQRRATWFRS